MANQKRISLVLVLGLILGLAAPAAAAEETTDAALSRVTTIVKDTLQLDTDQYDEFYGNRYEDGLVGIWSLYWSGTDDSLSIDALDDGTVVSYRLNQEGRVSNIVDFPTFPKGDVEAAYEAAARFESMVLAKGESILHDLTKDSLQGMDVLGGDSYRFSGNIRLNGKPSPLTYSITVRASDNQVISFRRDVGANMFLGDIPTTGRYVLGSDEAATILRDTLAVKLEYVYSEEDSNSAVLRYLPEDTDLCYVDVHTGEIINMTELMASMGGSLGGSSGAESDSATGDTGGNGLSQAEQEGIAKLEGVLSRDALDSRLRAQTAYGLGDYTLSSVSYQLVEAAEEEEEQVLCTLSYIVPGEDYRSRTITVDARTGVVKRVYSYAPSLEKGETVPLTAAQAQMRAEDFLEAFCAARWEGLALYDSQNGTMDRRPCYTFTYVQNVNGVPFPENAYTIAIDSGDGSVYRLEYQYNDTVTFASPEGIVGAAEALDAWAGTYETQSAYRLVPRALDSANAAEKRLLDLGMSYFFELRLAYALEREGTCLGIDAATGEPVWVEVDDDTLRYTDVEGTWVEADVERLAAYNVGYEGGVFCHQKELTQWDLVALLASLEGYRIDPEKADEWTVDAAYSAAYQMGVIRRGERDESKAVTRATLVKCLLDCAGYGPAARLQGIYTSRYKDADSIPYSDLGYAAIAQALGMVGERYDGDKIATRGELAAMLCRLLER